MKLQTRMLLQFLVIGVAVMAILGIMLPSTLRSNEIEDIKQGSIAQLKQVDFSLTTFISDVENDVQQLSLSDVVRTEEASNFTNFLNATGENFTYSTDPVEQQIITVLKDYQDSHPYVNSVYMGRENGAFVRAYPRAQPTQYDPRTRPWYVLGANNPGAVIMTEPYRALTTTDLNIGIVTALQRTDGSVYGVIGADITLKNLTSYLSSVGVSGGAGVMLVDNDGIILASEDSSLLFTNIYGMLREDAFTLLTTDQGLISHNQTSVVYYTSPSLNWKVLTVIPDSTVDHNVSATVGNTILFVFIALLLLSAIVLISFRYTVIRPLSNLTKVSEDIAKTGDLNQEIDVKSTGEIATLGTSFQSMVSRLEEEKRNRDEALKELEIYRDHLEELVEARTKELAIAKEAAESADRVKSAFLATMSHELRTPLNSIIGFTGIMQQELAGPLNAEQKKQMGMVTDSAEHLLALINDVLALSKIEAGQLTLANAPFDLKASVVKVIGSVGPLAQRKGITLEYDVADDIGPVVGDSRRIEQILLNLMSNGIKFTERGSVNVLCTREGKNVVFHVIDTGIGIGKADLDKLFKPFSQVDSGMTRHYEGTGLGLSICQKLTDLMGGSIDVISVVGEGTTFIVRLPILQNEKV